MTGSDLPILGLPGQFAGNPWEGDDIMNKQQLYTTLVDLCQQYGTTSETTYELLHDAIATIGATDEEDENG